MDNNKTSSGGVSFAGVLTVAFIALKITGVINWSWLWVLSPIWISFVIAVVLLLIIAIVARCSKWKT